MGQKEHKMLPNLTQTITSSQFLKRATKLLISISLCSFLFSSYSSWYSFFLHSMNSHSTFDKNFVFLIFNGLLVLIAKTSGSPRFNSNDNQSIKNIENGTQITTESVAFGGEFVIEDHDDACYNVMEEGEAMRLSDHELKEENHEEQEGKFDDLFDDEERGEEQHERIFMDETRENEIDLQGGDDHLYDDEDMEEDDEVEEERLEEKEINNIGVLSTEELNKKFDEFIRKMKEEIRIEAQRTLIIV